MFSYFFLVNAFLFSILIDVTMVTKSIHAMSLEVYDASSWANIFFNEDGLS